MQPWLFLPFYLCLLPVWYRLQFHLSWFIYNTGLQGFCCWNKNIFFWRFSVCWIRIRIRSQKQLISSSFWDITVRKCKKMFFFISLDLFLWKENSLRIFSNGFYKKYFPSFDTCLNLFNIFCTARDILKWSKWVWFHKS